MNKKIVFISLIFLSSMLYASMKFDSNKYVSVPDSDVFSFGDGTNDKPFTFTAWIYYTDSRDNTFFPVISKWTTTAWDGEYLFCIFETSSFGTAGVDQLFIECMRSASSNRIKAESTTAIPRNSWVHVGVTYDGSKSQNGLNLYMNGDLMAMDKALDGGYTAMQNLGAPVHIGAAITGTSFDDYADGRIDDVRIYNRELTAQEMATIGKTRSRYVFTDGLVGWWKMDDGVIDSVGRISDFTLYNNHGNPVNGVKYAASDWINYP